MKMPVFVDTQSKMQFLSTKQGYVMDGKVSLFLRCPQQFYGENACGLSDLRGIMCI